MRLVKQIVLSFAVLVLTIIMTTQTGPTHSKLVNPQLVLNPYEGIDWTNIQQHKANLHTHTDKSDGDLDPAKVIQTYHRLGYTILAITDHDNVGSRSTTWPWQNYNNDQDRLGMVAIQGNELSFQHHIGSYYNDYSGSYLGNVQTSLKQIGERDGLAVFFHPGRYNQPRDWRWYEPYFMDFHHLLGIEVFNQGNRYPNDRALWDNLLTVFMPNRPIWGFSNDDMHTARQLGKNWNTVLLEELNEKAVREALTAGRFYCTYQPSKNTLAPTIVEVITTETNITIKAINYTEMRWISKGKVIHLGNTLDYKKTPEVGAYVRAEIKGEGGVTLTNPFGFICEGLERAR